MSWQRENVSAAVSYLNALIAAGAEDCLRIRDGLEEVLNPALRKQRIERQRELDQMDAEGIKP